MQDREEKTITHAPRSSPQAPNWRHSLLTIFLTALVLRLAVITIGHTYRITPRRDHFQYGWEMGRIARSIALGQGFSSPTDLPTGPSAWAPPLYPYLLAGIFKVFGIYSNASAWVILALNSVFGALTCITLHSIARRIYGLNVAWAVAWTWAVFPYAIYWPVRVIWETSLSAFLLSLALWFVLRLGENSALLRDWAIFGLLWGVIALTNTSLLILLPAWLIWLWYRLPRRNSQLIAIGVCIVAAGLVVSPWLVRNYQTFGKFIFVRDNLPLEIHAANNDRSDGLWTRSEHPGNDPTAMQRFHDLGEIRFMEEKQQQVNEFVRERPGDFLRFTLQRAIYFWIGTPQTSLAGSYDLLPVRHVTFFLASTLAFAGLWLTLRNRLIGGYLLASLLILYPLPYYLVNPFPRYKHAIEPAMALLIVYLLVEARKISLPWPKAR